MFDSCLIANCPEQANVYKFRILEAYKQAYNCTFYTLLPVAHPRLSLCLSAAIFDADEPSREGIYLLKTAITTAALSTIKSKLPLSLESNWLIWQIMGQLERWNSLDAQTSDDALSLLR